MARTTRQAAPAKSTATPRTRRARTKAVTTPVAPETTQEELAAPAEPTEPASTPVPDSQEAAPPQTEAAGAIAVRTRTPVTFAKPELPPEGLEPITQGVPLISYKPPFSFNEEEGWKISSDGGKTNRNSGTTVVEGVPYDINLDISASVKVPGTHDYRFRLALVNREGLLVEVNLNGINPKKNCPGEWVVSGPTRSLLGAIVAMTQSGDDMDSFMSGVRLKLSPGTRGSLFIDTSVKYQTEDGPDWLPVSEPQTTLLVPSSKFGLVASVEQAKAAFRAAGYLQPTRAIRGFVPHDENQPEVVTVDCTTVIDG